MSRFEKLWAAMYADIRKSIFNLCKFHNFEPTWQQGDVLERVQWESRQPFHKRKKRIAVKSGQGPGKSTVSTYIAEWRTFQAVDAMTIVTAPTMTQLQDVFLGELRRQLKNADPILKRNIDIKSQKVTFGRRPNWMIRCRTAVRPENFQGYHDKYLTFIADDASGVDAGIIEQIQGTLTNEDSLFVAIGNPNTRSCKFYEFFTSQRHLWHTFTFNAEESPIVSRDNIQKLEDEYGRDSDVFRVRVLGEFPNMDPNCVVSMEDLEACTKNKPGPAASDKQFLNAHGERARQIGIDFARYGSDESVIYRRSGGAVVEWEKFTKTDPSRVVMRAMEMQKRAGWKDDKCWYVVDAGGMGQGVVHMLHDADKQVLEFHNGGKSSDPQYYDKVTEAWFTFARMAKTRKLSIPKDNRLIHQLCSRQYRTDHQKGKTKLRLESKEDYVKRLVREGVNDAPSPDRADAIVMAFYEGMLARSQSTGRDV
jgi:hypothetical protein